MYGFGAPLFPQSERDFDDDSEINDRVGGGEEGKRKREENLGPEESLSPTNGRLDCLDLPFKFHSPLDPWRIYSLRVTNMRRYVNVE